MITWIEQRTGLVSALKEFLTEDIPGGATYWYVWGSATLIVFTIQIITGIILTFYYSPSANTAWESTAFIYQHVYGGQFLISLHYWGASAMIVLVSVHLLQVLTFGAYKRPREIQWVVGVTLFFFTLRSSSGSWGCTCSYSATTGQPDRHKTSARRRPVISILIRSSWTR